MARIYTNSKIMCNQELREGIVAANGQFVVADGLQNYFENEIPWVRRGIARGEIVEVCTDNPDAAEEPAHGLSLSAATVIAEKEYRIKGSDLRKALIDGDIPGYQGNRKYDISEYQLRAGLDRMVEAGNQPPEPAVEPTEPAEVPDPTEGNEE